MILMITSAVLLRMSLRANFRFQNESRLPMQWWIDGSVNWTAPRPLALAFTPVLAVIVLVGTVLSTIFLEPHRGQANLEIPVILTLALTFVGVHALHLALMARTLKRPR
ncbi:hypothetical protein [Sphingomonas sp. BE138]|uniref:hypothetical protein n=1 Tax=Sphingomonas sp. BE138 TaxID=2817845 RepID=UPI00286BDD3D|nr:hypothetical protein [Sphingomonas sp. BE138]